MADLRSAIRRRPAGDQTIDPLIDAIAEFGGAVADSVGKDYRLSNPRVEKFLRGYMTDRVDMINATTREQVQAALRADDPTAAVREVFRHAREARAKMIAETEVVRSSGFAVIDSGKYVAELDFKRWISVEDDHVRDAHVEMHGQVRPWNDPFTAPNGATAQWPGGFSDPSLSVGCRCTAIPARAGQERELGEYANAVELYENLRSPMVERMTGAWQKVFDEQEAAVLAEIS